MLTSTLTAGASWADMAEESNDGMQSAEEQVAAASPPTTTQAAPAITSRVTQPGLTFFAAVTGAKPSSPATTPTPATTPSSSTQAAAPAPALAPAPAAAPRTRQAGFSYLSAATGAKPSGGFAAPPPAASTRPPKPQHAARPTARATVRVGEVDLTLDDSKDGINLMIRQSMSITPKTATASSTSVCIAAVTCVPVQGLTENLCGGKCSSSSGVEAIPWHC